MKVGDLMVGDVVQLAPNIGNPKFAGCFMTVTDLKTWGAAGYIQDIGQNGHSGARAYYRAPFAEMAMVGKATWIAGVDVDEGEVVK